jgi:outer membrane protein assembly factor BamB
VFVGSDDSKVYCLNASQGTLIWSYETGGAVFSSPVVADGKMYVGSNDGKVYCLDASQGTLLWSYQTGDEVFSSPAVADGKVFAGSFNGKVYCFDASQGTLLWSYQAGEWREWVEPSPAVADGKVFVGSENGKVYCLNASQGTLLWSYQTGDRVYSSPAVADGKVFVGSYDGKVYCFGSEEDAADTALLAYPQPFSHSRDTSMTFSEPSVPNGKIEIYNLAGELVVTLEEKYGASELSWDGRNQRGVRVAPGIYIVHIAGGTIVKIAVIK